MLLRAGLGGRTEGACFHCTGLAARMSEQEQHAMVARALVSVQQEVRSSPVPCVPSALG